MLITHNSALAYKWCRIWPFSDFTNIISREVTLYWGAELHMPLRTAPLSPPDMEREITDRKQQTWLTVILISSYLDQGEIDCWYTFMFSLWVKCNVTGVPGGYHWVVPGTVFLKKIPVHRTLSYWAINIRNGNGKFEQEIWALLKVYYLNTCVK